MRQNTKRNILFPTSTYKRGLFGVLMILGLVCLLGSVSWAGEKARKVDDSKLTADQIIKKMDRNMVFESRKSISVMKIHSRGRTKIKKMLGYSKGEDTGYTVFLSPARDKGVKYLKLKDNLWMYLPSAEKVIKISGHMLRQSMMGSDFSYEDMLDASALRKKYNSKRLKDEKIDGIDCYVIEMTQKKPGETYPKRKSWISKKYNVAMRSELYALSGRLLKIMKMSKIKTFGERQYPTIIWMTSTLKKGSWTQIELKNIEFKVKLPDQVFSLRNLQRE